jgi:uncharacterized integral membrane protein
MEINSIFKNSIKLIVEGFAVAIPNLIKAILIFLIGYYISKAVTKIIEAILTRSGVDRFGEKIEEIEIISKANVKVKISKIVAKIIYAFILLIFIVAATDILGISSISNLVAKTIEFIPNLIVAIIIIVGGLLISDSLRKLIQRTCESLGIGSAKMIGMVVFYFCFISVFMMALGQIQVNTQFLETNLSIIVAGGVLAFSIGYGLASKETVANYLSNRYAKEKISKGDNIKIGNIQGVVQEINNDSIVLKSDGQTIILPMHKIIKEDIIINN